MSDKISFAKYFIADFPQVFTFIFINGNEYNAIISKQVPSDFESRIYHIEPIGMETTVGLSVALHGINYKIPVLIVCAISLLKIFYIICEIISIDEVVAGVVRWVNIYHFDLTEVCFSQDFEDIEVVPLNIEIFGIEATGSAVFAH